MIARHTLPNASSRPFGPASLLEISEIGLVVDDVPAMAAHLHADLGLDVYANSLSADFAAVGDARGLLILARRGRPWFAAAGRAAAPLPLIVALTDAAGRPRTLTGPPYVAAD